MDIKQQKKSARRAFNSALALREAESKVICKKIHESCGMDRWAAWNDKRSYGNETRALLLASGFVKGIPYKAIEAKVGERNAIGASDILWAASALAGIALEGNAIVAWLEGAKPETIFAEPAAVPVVAICQDVCPGTAGGHSCELPEGHPGDHSDVNGAEGWTWPRRQVIEPPKSETGVVAGLKRLFGAA
jgi:hypothetical protein